MHLLRINPIFLNACVRNLSNFSCVPKYDPVNETDLIKLKGFLTNHKRICVLTGAGISTESGIYFPCINQ